MDWEPRKIFTQLLEYSNDENQASNCTQLLENVYNILTSQQQNIGDLDSYILHMFDKSHGLLNFVSAVVSKSSYKDSIVYIMKILYTFINNFHMKLDKYAVNINEICLKIVNSSKTTATEKTTALDVLVIGFEKTEPSLENQEHYKKLYEQLHFLLKLQTAGSVKQKILTALGVFAKKFQYFIENPDELKNLFISQINFQAVQRNINYSVIAGAFTGLMYFSENFVINKDDANVKSLFPIIDKLLVPEHHSRVVNRAALTFLANNISVFSDCLIGDYERWHKSLLKWFEFSSSDDKKVAYTVIAAFYQGLTLADNVTENAEFIQYFMDYFTTSLENPSLPSHEKKICLQGIHSFSSVFYSKSPEKFTQLFIVILQSFENLYIHTQNQQNEESDYLPDYIKTLASFIQFRSTTHNDILCLQKGVIYMIKIFPYMQISHTNLVIESLITVFFYLKQHDLTKYDNFVHNTIYHGVIRSCDHNHISEAEIEDNDKLITVKNYYPFWSGLLRIDMLQKFDKIGIYFEERRQILLKIVENLVKTLLILINKLNLTIEKIDDTNCTDIRASHKVSVIDDLKIYSNLVDLYQEIFKKINPQILRKCICKLINHLINKCIDHDLISGFYKLLSYSLQISNKLNLFNQSTIENMSDVSICFESLIKFLEILLMKIQQFKDDLLIASLQVLLEYPTIILKESLESCIPAFILIFNVGKNYTPLVFMAIDTLEAWQSRIDIDIMQPFLEEIIPLLSSFLQSKSLTQYHQSKMIRNKRKTERPMQKTKVVLEIESDLIRLQRRIIHFIGQQNNVLCKKFVRGSDVIQLAQWGDQQHLKIDLPFEDIRLHFYLDTILPRVIHLALNSNDRKIRISACELLHATVMVFLGNARGMNKDSLKDLDELLRNVAFPLLQLGCDMDQLVQQLFNPLFLQLTHWYTHEQQIRSNHSAIIIEAMLDGITHPTDSALRDYSGQCINEFIKWTIKQSTELSLAHDPIIFKVFTQKMRFFSTHPDPSKKLGSALIFNNIYKLIREEERILSMFWIEYLHIFLTSLSIIDENTLSSIAIVQIESALDHILRGFIEMAQIFNKNDEKRRIPTGIKSPLLKDICIWILLQSGSLNNYCRKKSLEMFVKLTPKMDGFEDIPSFVHQYLTQSELMEIYEKFLITHPTLRDLNDNNPSILLRWLNELSRSLDGYNFIIKNSIYKNNVLSPSFIKSIKHFISEIVFMKIDVALNLIDSIEWLPTSLQKQEFRRRKVEVIIKLLQFCLYLLENNELKVEFKILANLDLWDLFTTLIFNPTSIDFDNLSQNINDVFDLMKLIIQRLPPKDLNELNKNLNSYIDNNDYFQFELKMNAPIKQRNFIKGLIFLQKCNLKSLQLQKIAQGNIRKLVDKFTCNLENGTVYIEDLQDTTIKHCIWILEFCLNYTEELQELIKALYIDYQICNLETNEPIKFANYLLILFNDVISRKILENFSVFLSINENVNMQIEIIIHVLTYMEGNKQLWGYKKNIVNDLITHWEKYLDYFREDISNAIAGFELINLLLPIKDDQVNVVPMMKWILELLQTDNLEVNLIIDLIQFLGHFVKTTDFDDELRTILSTTSSKYFESPSMNSLHRLIQIIPSLRSIEILDFIINIYISQEQFHENINIEEILQLFVKITSPEFLAKTMQHIFNKSFDKNIEELKRYRLFSKLITIFYLCAAKIFENFYCENITKIITIIKQPPNEPEIILQKTIQFMLIEIMFSRFPIIKNDPNLSPIVKAAGKNNNGDILADFLKNILNTSREKVNISEEYHELVRLYRCRSYNALVSIVSNSIKNEKFYLKLFARIEDDKDILWNGLIDTNKVYLFTKDFDTIPERRKVLINIRDNLRGARKQVGSLNSVNYLQTQRGFSSSLKEDFTKYDFTNTNLRSVDVELMEYGKNDPSLEQGEIELDMVDINKHECMATVCGLIEHLIRSHVTELPDDTDIAATNIELPLWIKEIRSILLHENTHPNVKIFWVKVIDNTIHIFKHYAKSLLEPLLKFVVDKIAGESLNYFVVDVVAILAKWSSEIQPETQSELALSEKLLIFLIEQIDNERRDIFKYHLELIKLLVEAWKSTIKVPYNLLFQKLNDVDIQSKKIEIGIHLSSIFVANKIAPWQSDNYPKFCRRLFDIILQNTQKSTYTSAAETVGLILKFVDDETRLKLSKNIQLLLKKITDIDKYSCCLEALTLYSGDVVDSYNLSRLLSKIHVVPTSTKVTYLKIILKAGEVVEEISEFLTEDWSHYLEQESFEIQFLTLELVLKNLDVFITSAQSDKIIQSVCKHETNSFELCRSRMYDILIKICSNYSKDNKTIINSYQLCKNTLINGLIDKDEEIRNKVFIFWEQNANLPSQISKRLPFLLESLYTPNTENHFLEYNTYLLLSILKTIDEYHEELFNNPLENCDFEEQNLNMNWRDRHSSVVPLFAETLRSTENYETFYNNSDIKIDELRQTQKSFVFTPTQSSVRTKQITQMLSSQSSLFINSNSINKDDGHFINPNMVTISQTYKVPKRRFLKDKSKISRSMANYHVKRSVEDVKKLKYEAKKSENKVQVFRKYRKGDFPDIQITMGAVLEPLFALILHDYELAKTLYTSLTNNIMNRTKTDLEFIKSMSKGIRNIFENSIHYNTNLFRTLFDVILSCESSLSFDPEIIANVSQSSGLFTIGSVVLEEYLNKSVFEEAASTSKKSRGFESSAESNYWVKLAELYKEMDEWDMVRAIFLEKMNCSDIIQEALQAESSKQWRKAQEYYQQLIEIDETIEKKDFYYESYFKCFAHLGEWDKMSTTIEQFISNDSPSNPWDNLLKNDWNQQKLLPWYIQSQLKQTLFNQSSAELLAQELHRLLESENSNYIQNNFAEELCMFSIYRNEIGVAREHLKIFTNNFLEQWHLLDPVYFNLRYNKILRLRNIIDIKKFLELYEILNADNMNLLKDYIKYWDQSLEETLPSILLNETRVLYRRQFINLLVNKLKTCDGDNLKPMLIDLAKAKYRLDADLIDSALEQNNYYLARKYFSIYKDKNILRLHLSLNKLGYLRAKTLEEEPNQQIDVLCGALKPLESVFAKSEDMNSTLLAYLQQFQTYEELSTILNKNPDLSGEKIPEILAIIKEDISTPDTIILKGAKDLASFLSKYEEKLYNEMETDDSALHNKEYKLISQAFVKLAYFAKNRDDFGNFMLYVLKGMKMESGEARQLFPCIIMQKLWSDEEKHVFLDETKTMPDWMFLDWIPQLLANIDTSNVSLVSPIVLRIAKRYPQAIMYAYRLSKENYTNSEESKDVIEKLDEILLPDERVDTFLLALSFISMPTVILEYFILNLKKATEANNELQFQTTHQYIMEKIFIENPNSTNINSLQGNMFKNISKFKKDLIKIKDSTKTNRLNMLEKLRNVLSSFKRDSSKKKEENLLKNYSPWLANFSADHMDIDLEIPGQYSGKRNPLPQHHVKISGFHPNVKCMESLRAPIKITILGNNLKEYPFLIKFGEDLRQDQRISQIFNLMNNIFENDVHNQRDLSLDTYQIIPLTTNLGLIQWVDNTETLQEFLFTPSTIVKYIEEIRKKYYRFLRPSTASDVETYGRMFKNYNSDRVITNYRSLVNEIPNDILKQSFVKLSANTDSYFALRNNFIRSYAVMCTCQWLLGIGDRHLSNLMVSKKNGRILGIDFGHAFGTATQLLPIPEMVPFRLTPHIISIMEPMGERGLFREVMIHTLRSLRSNKDSLLATMQVFIEEPSLNWCEHAMKFQVDRKGDLGWYPARKIQQAREKFEGANCVVSMVEDLSMGHQQNKEVMEACIRLVKGDPSLNVRARKKEKNLSVEDQVDCLLDLATDYNLLGRMFHGWSAWV